MYTKAVDGDEVLFKVSPPAAPWPWLLSVTVFLFGGACLIFMWPWGTLAAAAMLVGLPYWYRAAFLNKYRLERTFKVSPRGLDVDGKHVGSGDIHRIIVRNHMMPEQESEVTMVIVGGGQSARSLQAGMVVRRALGKSCYRVDVEAMGVAYPLAGGLAEPMAFAIATEVKTALAAG